MKNVVLCRANKTALIHQVSGGVPPYSPDDPARWHPSRSSAWNCDKRRESSGGSGCQKIPLVTMPQTSWVAKTLQSICMADPAFFSIAPFATISSQFRGFCDHLPAAACFSTRQSG
jgi:hypothetical protein